MKKIWILNHYATEMFYNKGGRHHCFAKYLIKAGYDVTIFCASSRHNSVDNLIKDGKLYYSDEVEGIPYVFVRARDYEGNGKSRVLNMLDYYFNVKKTAKDFSKPDVIIGSSVHPLACVAALNLSKKFKCKNIVEIRDLWPASIVAYGLLKRESLIAKILYQGEKWIYKKSDKIIMTWEGGRQYIVDEGWSSEVNLDKIVYISNGIDMEVFDRNILENDYGDSDLEDKNYKNIIYTGSIRRVNNVGLLLDAAKIIQKYNGKIRFLIYGSGNEQEMLENRCREELISNVFFKGKVEKKMIPSILKKSYATILHNSSTALDKYGQSQNKLFEYLAAGKGTIQTYTTGYNILKKNGAGICINNQSAEEIANVVIDLCNIDEKIEEMGINARNIACDYDFKNLSNKLIAIIEGL